MDMIWLFILVVIIVILGVYLTGDRPLPSILVRHDEMSNKQALPSMAKVKNTNRVRFADTRSERWYDVESGDIVVSNRTSNT